MRLMAKYAGLPTALLRDKKGDNFFSHVVLRMLLRDACQEKNGVRKRCDFLKNTLTNAAHSLLSCQ